MIGRLFTGKVLFSIKKARKMLGYQPEVDFAEGMRRTAEWIYVDETLVGHVGWQLALCVAQ